MENVELGKFNEFECQVSPDHQNHHQQLRAKAVLNVIGRRNCKHSLALNCSALQCSAKTIKKRIIFIGLNWPKVISMEFPFIVKNCSQNVC